MSQYIPDQETDEQEHSNHPGPSEGKMTKAIEAQTAKVPSSGYLLAAAASIGGSMYLKSVGRDRDALFVGQWVAPFLILGLYNKVVKTHGSD